MLRDPLYASLGEFGLKWFAARLAAPGKLGVAVGELRSLVLLGLRPLGEVGAILKILRGAAPPLRVRAHRRQRNRGDENGDSQRR